MVKVPATAPYRGQLGAHGAAKLSCLIGVYCMVSVTLKAFDVPVPE